MESRLNLELKKARRGSVVLNYFLVALYPLSLLHLIQFLKSNRRNDYLRGRSYDILSVHLGGIATAAFIVMGSSGDSRNGLVTFFSFLFLIAFPLLIVFRICGTVARKRRVAQLQEYFRLVMGPDQMRSPAQIARATGRDPMQVLGALEFMMGVGALPFIQLQGENEGREDDKVEVNVKVELKYKDDGGETEGEGKSVPVAVKCSGCGYTTKVNRNESTTCQYCGSPIVA